MKILPLRLILFLVFLVLLAFFMGFNLEHKMTISLGVVTFSQVPVFFGLFVAFVLGALVILPFRLGGKPDAPRTPAPAKTEPLDEDSPL